MTIHWLLRPTKRGIRRGASTVTTLMANSTKFLVSVCALVRWMASPKQPQSFTGLATTIHTVTSVIRAMNTVTSLVTSRRRMAKSRKMPRQNSKAERLMEQASSIHDGT